MRKIILYFNAPKIPYAVIYDRERNVFVKHI